MKIYTKTGDKGTTSLVGGSRVAKDDPRLEAYGTVDELNSFIGLLSDTDGVSDPLKTELASLPEDIEKYRIPVVTQADIEALETSIDRMQESLVPLKKFILPGGHPSVSLAHVARSVCRRAERRTVTLCHAESEAGLDTALRYLNRLSDYLFVAARFLAHEQGIPERFWE